MQRNEKRHLIRAWALSEDALAKNLISAEGARKKLLRVKHGGIGGPSFVSYARELAVVLLDVRKLVIKNL